MIAHLHKNISIRLFISVCIIVSYLFASNKHPIILMHGFMGWGRDEMNGYYYWGGKMDLESHLKSLGYDVYTVSVGPISSNWDRAVEMFYQIKGGSVDYGKVHSEKFKIKQFPDKNFKGLYPEWDEKNPVHIIAHSQGGQTARMLEHLLYSSFNKEDFPDPLSPLINPIFPFETSKLRFSTIDSVSNEKLKFLIFIFF